VIRYFLQGRYGPWYEIEEMQWAEAVGLPVVTQPDDYLYEEYDLPLMRCVVVNTAKAWKDDIKREFPGLQDLIWFPDMRCGECGGRLVDELASEPDKRYPRYVHATGMMDRHGAWPVEQWD
jgi:hypothetical protein